MTGRLIVSAVLTAPLLAHTMSEGQTVMFVSVDGVLAGSLGVIDPIKPSTKNAIRDLHAQGLRIVMLTGDSRTTANAIGKQLDLEEVIAEALPERNGAEIARLRASVIGNALRLRASAWGMRHSSDHSHGGGPSSSEPPSTGSVPNPISETAVRTAESAYGDLRATHAIRARSARMRATIARESRRGSVPTPSSGYRRWPTIDQEALSRLDQDWPGA